MRLGEGRHAGVAGKRRAKHENGDSRARALAEAHAKIEQRAKAEFLEQEKVARFGRAMAGKSVVERIGAKLCQGRHGSGANETVEQHRYMQMPRGERRTKNGGKLAPAQRSSDAQRIFEDLAMTGKRLINDLPLSLEAFIVEAGAVTGKARTATAE